MTIKLILVPMDGSDRSLHALCTAQVVAKRFDAHIKAVHVREKVVEPYMFNSMPTTLKQTYVEAAQNATNELTDRANTQFNQFVSEYGLEKSDVPLVGQGASASLHVFDGNPQDVLIREGRLVDVITVSRPAADRIGGQIVGERLESLLMNTGRPVLVVPPGWVCHQVEHAAIGWNDSPEASRALFMTMPWLSQMKKVTVITSGNRRDSADRVQEYLSLHDCDTEIHLLEGRGGSVGQRLLDTCAASGAEFLVVGGFSHTRARQRLFGGVTSYLLKNTNIITAMVH